MTPRDTIVSTRRGALLALATLPIATAARAETPCRETAGILRGSGALGIIVERASGSIVIFDAAARQTIARVSGFGDLSHASAVFSPDERFAYIFGRDGGLSKLDLLTATIVNRVVQAGNSIGGAISDDGALIAVANYEPGGVKVFDAGSLKEVADIPSLWSGGRSKVVGLEDAPGRRFLFSLWDGNEIWIADFSAGDVPEIVKFSDTGKQPYDALISSDGRYYLAGLFGEDGVTLIDLWQKAPAPRRILAGYGQGQQKLPVYKMPHLESWAQAGERFVLPAVGRHELLWVDGRSFAEVARTAVHSQPVFAVARPDGRHVWVNFAHPHNDTLQVVDSVSGEVIKTWKPGPAVLHIEFSPRGNEAWISVRDANVVQVYNTHTFQKVGEIAVESPSGIFLTARAHRGGL